MSSKILRSASTLMKMLRLPSHRWAVDNSAAYRRPISTVPRRSSDSEEYETDGSFSASESERIGFLQDTDETKLFQEKESNDGMIQFKNDVDVARIRLELPGIDKERLKLWFDGEAMNFKASAIDEHFGQERFYEGSVEMPMEMLKVQDTKADIKNGVLNVVIPKLPLEERSDIVIIHVSE